MTEVVVRVLRTPRGSFLPDPTFGVDYRLVTKAHPNSPATLQSAIVEALKRFTDIGLITDLTVNVERRGTQLLWEVIFRDPRGTGASPVRLPGVL